MDGNEIAQFLQNYKPHEIYEDHSKKLFEVMQVISKRNTLKWPLYFLRAVEYWATFGIQIDINFATFSGKFQNYTF